MNLSYAALSSCILHREVLRIRYESIVLACFGGLSFSVLSCWESRCLRKPLVEPHILSRSQSTHFASSLCCRLTKLANWVLDQCSLLSPTIASTWEDEKDLLISVGNRDTYILYILAYLFCAGNVTIFFPVSSTFISWEMGKWVGRGFLWIPFPRIKH